VFLLEDLTVGRNLAGSFTGRRCNLVLRTNCSDRFREEEVFFDSFRVTGGPWNDKHVLGAHTLIKYEETFSIIDQFLEV